MDAAQQMSPSKPNDKGRSVFQNKVILRQFKNVQQAMDPK
jgi:hypothetical protein